MNEESLSSRIYKQALLINPDIDENHWWAGAGCLVIVEGESGRCESVLLGEEKTHFFQFKRWLGLEPKSLSTFGGSRDDGDAGPVVTAARELVEELCCGDRSLLPPRHSQKEEAMTNEAEDAEQFIVSRLQAVVVQQFQRTRLAVTFVISFTKAETERMKSVFPDALSKAMHKSHTEMTNLHLVRLENLLSALKLRKSEGHDSVTLENGEAQLRLSIAHQIRAYALENLEGVSHDDPSQVPVFAYEDGQRDYIIKKFAK